MTLDHDIKRGMYPDKPRFFGLERGPGARWGTLGYIGLDWNHGPF